MAIRTVVFDFGNVVAFFDHGRAVARLAPFSALKPHELTLQLYGSAIEDAYERGDIGTDEYIRAAIANGQLSCSAAEFRAAFVDIFWPNPEVCDLLPRLKPAHRVLLASNTTLAHFEEFSRAFAEPLAHADYLGTSFRARARKPEAAFFAHIQEHADCAPHECAFVDDLPVNVEAAERFGWKGVVYRPDGTLAQKLRALGVAVGT